MNALRVDFPSTSKLLPPLRDFIQIDRVRQDSRTTNLEKHQANRDGSIMIADGYTVRERGLSALQAVRNDEIFVKMRASCSGCGLEVRTHTGIERLDCIACGIPANFSSKRRVLYSVGWITESCKHSRCRRVHHSFTRGTTALKPVRPQSSRGFVIDGTVGFAPLFRAELMDLGSCFDLGSGSYPGKRKQHVGGNKKLREAPKVP